jgi:hypothetical protein
MRFACVLLGALALVVGLDLIVFSPVPVPCGCRYRPLVATLDGMPPGVFFYNPEYARYYYKTWPPGVAVAAVGLALVGISVYLRRRRRRVELGQLGQPGDELVGELVGELGQLGGELSGELGRGGDRRERRTYFAVAKVIVDPDQVEDRGQLGEQRAYFAVAKVFADPDLVDERGQLPCVVIDDGPRGELGRGRGLRRWLGLRRRLGLRGQARPRRRSPTSPRRRSASLRSWPTWSTPASSPRTRPH